MKYAFMTFSTPELSLDDVVAAATQYGYDGVEPRLDAGHGHGVEVAASATKREAIKRTFAESGIVAACLATSAAEPSLTSLAGGGAMLYHDAASGSFSYCDCFANAPGIGAPPARGLDFFAVDLNWGPTLQRFHIGRGSAAVPGLLPGVFAAQERWGQLPSAEVVAPACRMMREGVTLDAYRISTFELLEPILLHSAKTRAIYGKGDRLRREGEIFRNPNLADTLEQLATPDWRRFYREEIGGAILRDFGVDNGGRITAEDLDRFEVLFRDSLRLPYRGAEVYLNPPPSAGGTLIGLALQLLDTIPLGELERARPDHLRALVAAMRVVDESRHTDGDPLAAKALAHWKARFPEVLAAEDPDAPAPVSMGPPSTTHISALDAAGNGAAITVTYGEGNGYIIGDTGLVMNNLMGEEDLFPRGFHQWPVGTRLSTGVCPMAITEPSGALTIMGTGGANRIRTAILQVVSNLVDFGLPLDEAVRASRVHWEGGVLNAEIRDLPGGAETVEAVKAPGDDVVLFDTDTLFFGGVHAVRRTPDGTLSGAGDVRRFGHVVVAER